MKPSEKDKWLDQIISRAAATDKPVPNFEKWKQQHPKAVEVLKSQAQQRTGPGEKIISTIQIWRVIMRSTITKLAAAAAVIIAVVIGISSLDGSGAWANVVKAFNKATDVHITETWTSAGGRVVRENEAWVKNQTLFRAEAQNWSVVDDGRNVLTLYKEHKIAHLRESFTPYWDYTPLILKVFRDNDSASDIIVTKVPEESTEEAYVYQIDFRGQWQGKAWVDAASSLAWQVIGRQDEDEGRTRDFKISFDYEPIAAGTFSTVIPRGFTELPRVRRRSSSEERQEILLGRVVDGQGSPVGDAQVYASFAHYGRTHENGDFALIISPTDNSNSLGPMDFPMFLWAFREDDPYRLAWTVIRHPQAERSEQADAVLEETHQGVELLIANEDELQRSIPGDPGEFFGDLDGDPKVRHIVLVMAPAGVITGKVANASGQAIANATVLIEEFQMQLGTNRLTISNLDYEWKAEAFAVTDDNGCYQLSNLPMPWDRVQLKVKANGYKTDEKEFESGGRNTVEGCDFQLVEGQDTDEEDTSKYHTDHLRGAGFGVRRRVSSPTEQEPEQAEEAADGEPVKGGGSSTAEVVPPSLRANLVLYYSFCTDDGESVTDISGSGKHGQAQGTQYTTDDVLGGAMAFDGENDYISVPDVYLKNFTFSAWVNTEVTGGSLNNRRIFLLTDGEKCYALQGNSDSLSVYLADGVELNEYNWSFAKSIWTHITLTHDGQTCRIYKNGRLTESGDIETSGVTGTLYIGGTDQHRGGFWEGMIDEVAVFNRALSEAEIEQLFNMTGAADLTPLRPSQNLQSEI